MGKMRGDLTRWMATILSAALSREVDEAEITKCLLDRSPSREKVSTFLQLGTNHLLLFHIGKNRELILDSNAENFEPKIRSELFVYFIKLYPFRAITSIEDITYGSIYAQKKSDVLEYIRFISGETYLPCICRGQWQILGDSIEDFVDAVNDHIGYIQMYLGHEKGKIRIPIPVTSESSIYLSWKQKNVAFRLKKYLSLWTDKINAALVFSFDATIDEFRNWKQRTKELKSLLNQLQSQQVRRVLRILDDAKLEGGNNAFSKKCKELFWAYTEAKSNTHFLRPLKSHFKALYSEPIFKSINQYFTPIIHLALLVWKTSAYFNTKQRLAEFIQKLCYYIEKRSHDYLSSLDIVDSFNILKVQKIINKYCDVISVIGRFKAVVVSYKKKSRKECPRNPWDIGDSGLFSLLNVLLDKCHNEIEIYNEMIQYSCLNRYTLGWNNMLANAASQVNACYQESIRKSRKWTETRGHLYAFYEHKIEMRELDNQVASLLLNIVDNHNWQNKLYILFSNFSSIIQRPVVFKQIQSTIDEICHACISDIVLLSGKKNQEHNSLDSISYMSSTVQELTRARGLLERTRRSLDMLKALNTEIIHNSNGQKLVREYTTFEGKIFGYEREKLNAFRRIITSELSKLDFSAPVVEQGAVDREQNRREMPTLISLKRINKHKFCLSLFKEVEKCSNFDFSVDKAIYGIIQKLISLKSHQHRTIMIAYRFNRIIMSTLEVEKPLMRSELAFLSGLPSSENSKAGESILNRVPVTWASSKLTDFLSKSESELSSLDDVVRNIKVNTSKIDSRLKNLANLTTFKNSSTIESDLVEVLSDIVGDIREIIKLIKAGFRHEPHHEDWQMYLAFIERKVSTALTQALVGALKAIKSSLEESSMFDSKDGTEFTIKVTISTIFCQQTYKNRIRIGEAKEVEGAIIIVRKWFHDSMSICAKCPCISSSKQSYFSELIACPEVIGLVANLNKFCNDAILMSENCLRPLFSLESEIFLLLKVLNEYCSDDFGNVLDESLCFKIQDSFQRCIQLKNEVVNFEDYQQVLFLSISCKDAKTILCREIDKVMEHYNNIISIFITRSKYEISEVFKDAEIMRLEPIQIFQQVVTRFKFTLSKLDILRTLQKHNPINRYEHVHLNEYISKVKEDWEKLISASFRFQDDVKRKI